MIYVNHWPTEGGISKQSQLTSALENCWWVGDLCYVMTAGLFWPSRPLYWGSLLYTFEWEAKWNINGWKIRLPSRLLCWVLLLVIGVCLVFVKFHWILVRILLGVTLYSLYLEVNKSCQGSLSGSRCCVLGRSTHTSTLPILIGTLLETIVLSRKITLVSLRKSKS